MSRLKMENNNTRTVREWKDLTPVQKDDVVNQTLSILEKTSITIHGDQRITIRDYIVKLFLKAITYMPDDEERGLSLTEESFVILRNHIISQNNRIE